MKVAIIGSGPSAAATSIKFDDLGADVRVFARKDWSSSAISNETLNQLEQRSLRVSPCEIKRIHKAHLAKNAPGFGGKSRLSDMFRVVVSENPSDGVLKQMKENPEVFEKLGEKVLDSLSEPVENFHDVDIVIACEEELSTQPGLSPSGAQVLNEHRAGDSIYHLYRLPDPNTKLDGKTLVVGGMDEILTIISKQCHEVTQLKVFGENTISKEWFSFLNKAKDQWESEQDSYQQKIYEWRELEDYIRVKVPMPAEPKNLVETHDEATLISLDLLIDQPGIFATIELVPDGNITTLKFDQIFNARKPQWDILKLSGLAIELSQLRQTIIKSEPGFYAIAKTTTIDKTIETIIADVMNWFKPVSHE